jgi:serine protease SohB
MEYGLVDRIGDLRSTLRERYGDKVETPLVAPKTSLFGRATPGVGAGLDGLLDRPGLTDELISSLEARAMWARYGL